MKDNIQKDLEDFGWASMRELLDKEMPLQAAAIQSDTEGVATTALASGDKEKGFRKRWLSLLLLLCFVGCGVASYQFFKSDATAKQSPSIAASSQQKGNMPLKGDALITDLNSTFETTQKPINTTQLSENSLAENDEIILKTPLKNVETQASESQSAVEVFNKNTVEKPLNDTKIEFSNSDDKKSVLNEKDIKTPLNNDKREENLTQSIVLKEEITTVKRAEIAVFEPFGAFELTPVSIKKIVKTPLSATILKPVKRPIEWGITVGVHSVLNSERKWVNGFQVGSIIQKPLNNKWSISTGLAYRSTVAVGDSLTYFRIENLAQSNTSTVGTASPSLNSAQTIHLNRLRYIEMPLYMTYNLGKRWGFSGGVKGAFLLSKNFTTGSSNLYVFDPAGQSSKFANNVVYDTAFGTALGLERWDCGLIGGVQYRPMKHFNIALQYDFGLNNILQKPNWGAYNRYLGLNVNYMF